MTGDVISDNGIAPFSSVI